MSENKKKTYVALVLDRSGSMWNTREQAITFYNEEVKAIKENAKDQDIQCCLISFNHDVVEHFWLQPADQLMEACQGDYNCDGNTALWDAWGHAIDKLQETTKQDEDVAYLVRVITDGQENASQHISAETLFAKVDSLQQTGKWTFTLMGADMSELRKIAQAAHMPLSNLACFTNVTKGHAQGGYKASTKRARKFYAARAAGASAVNNFYNDTLEAMADFSSEVDADADVSSPSLSFGAASLNSTGPVRACAFTPGATTNEVVDEPGKARVFSSGQKVSWVS